MVKCQESGVPLAAKGGANTIFAEQVRVNVFCTSIGSVGSSKLLVCRFFLRSRLCTTDQMQLGRCRPKFISAVNTTTILRWVEKILHHLEWPGVLFLSQF